MKTIKNLLKSQKIKIACEKLDCQDHNRLYLAMHNAYENGMDTQESFNIPVGDFEKAGEVLSKWFPAMFVGGYGFNDNDEGMRITRDELFREKHFEMYSEKIKPLAEEIKFYEIIESFFKAK